jgi:intracellular multiplication protein IcmO
MKIEDPLETWEFFMKTAGESYVTHVGGFQTDSRSITGQYMDTKSAQLEKRARIDLLDLKEQREGEAHIFFKSRIVRAKMFYANPAPVKEIRLNQFVKVDFPQDIVLKTLVSGIENFKKIIGSDKNLFADLELTEDDIKNIAAIFSLNQDIPPIENGISALLDYHDRISVKPAAEELEVELPEGKLNIFTKLHISPYLERIILAEDLGNFTLPLLSQAEILDQITYIERLSGKADQYANNVAVELIRDMQNATHYPPEIYEKPDPLQLSDKVQELIKQIVITKEAHNAKMESEE